MRRLLLTSAGVRNTVIGDALVGMLGRPIGDCTALCIPTAMYGHPHAGPGVNVWESPAGDDRTIGVVDFAIFPHLDHESLPDNTLAKAQSWAAGLDCPAYAIDDETAIRVVDGTVDVVSEGHWFRFDA